MGLSWQQGPLSPGAIGRFLMPEPLHKRLLYAEPLRRRMRVRFGGVWVADSENVLLLFEPGHYPMAYFPESAELAAGLDDTARKRTANWDRLIPVRDVVLKHLDTARNEKLIGAPLEARVRLSANGELYALLEQYAKELPGLFIVSQVEFERAEGDELGVKVERAGGEKCERCWKYTMDVGSDPDFPTICLPCAGAVHEIING